MTVSVARKIAFDVLLRVTTQHAYADDALRAALAQFVSAEDAGLATELTLGVVRWQRLLDFLIDRHLAHSNKGLDPEVRIALRLGAYQLHFLTRIPARAAVHESVELVKRARKRSAAPMVNAILRKCASDSSKVKNPGESVAALLANDVAPAERLGIQFSHPTWLVERWLRAWGEERTRALLEANNRVPSLSAHVLDPQHREDALVALNRSGCIVSPGHLLRESLTLAGGNPSAGEAMRRGWIAIQDEASQAVACLVGVQSGDTVLDLCAAPGGKTLKLALDAGPDGKVIAADLHAHRVRAMAERFEKASVGNVETITIDATGPLPSSWSFHRILVDVPCSGTGTLARHPEIRWRLRPEDLEDLHKRQTALLRNALSHLARGGTLVYSTCSLEPEENEHVVNNVLAESKAQFQILSASGRIQPFLSEFVKPETIVGTDGFFRTFPPEHRTDGFFAAVIEHKGA